MKRSVLQAGWRPTVWAMLLLPVAVLALDRPLAAAEGFPFDQELLLDTKPMRGSKRVPTLDIGANGAVVIDLWCNSVQGQLVVAADTVTVLTGPKTDRSCPPERVRGDEEVLSALEEVTNWRREGDTLVLVGPRSLRFYRATN